MTPTYQKNDGLPVRSMQNSGRLDCNLCESMVRDNIFQEQALTISRHASSHCWHPDSLRALPLRLAITIAAVLTAGCDEATVIAASRGATELSPLLLWLPTLAALVWAGVAYTALGWANRLPLARTPRTNAVILVGGGVVLPVMVMTGLLGLLGMALAL